MKLIDIYNKIQNPIADKNLIKQIIKIYTKSEYDEYFYNGLVTTYPQNSYISKSDADIFFSEVYKIWHQNISNMTLDEYMNYQAKGYCAPDFVNFREALMKSPKEVHSRKEMFDVLYKISKNKEVSKSAEVYKWTRDLGSFIHVESHDISAFKDDILEVKHRLYLNISTKDIYKIATLLFKKYLDHNIPYYFKLYQYDKPRDENIVIYTDNEHLLENIQILNEIKREHQELINSFNSPTILSGKINSWLGYGSEPARDQNGNPHSYNEIREKVLRRAIEKTGTKWINDHLSLDVKIKNHHMPLIEHLYKDSQYKILESLKEKILSYEKRYCREKAYNANDIREEYGLCHEDLSIPIFRKYVYNIAKKNIDKYILTGNWQALEDEFLSDLIIEGYNNKTLIVNKVLIKQSIKEFINYIMNYDPTFIDEVQKNIISECKNYNIDPDKFCFDINTVAEMQAFDQINASNAPVNNQPQINATEAKENDISKGQEAATLGRKENSSSLREAFQNFNGIKVKGKWSTLSKVLGHAFKVNKTNFRVLLIQSLNSVTKASQKVLIKK